MAKTITPLGVEIDHKEYWKKRKEEMLWCRMQINYDRMKQLLSSGQFNLDDFCSFLFPKNKKAEIAKKMIEYIKESKEPVFFKQMVETMDVPRSTAWQVYLMLKRAGIIQRKTKAEPLRLSTKFSEAVEELELWWKNFVKVR
jgi:hypothetical protein